MIVVVGLGPIGAGVGAALAARGERVVGVDPDGKRAATWASATGMPVARDLRETPDLDQVEVVIIAVRLAAQLWSVLDALPIGARPVFVLTTLAVADARALADSPHAIAEAPVSGGAAGARDGTLTMFLHAHEPLSPSAQRVVEAITQRVFRFDGFGQPAVAKLANNTLSAYNALAVATVADVAARAGLDHADFLRVVGASSGQSWIADHFADFDEALLFKDVELLKQETRELPVIHLTDVQSRTAEIDDVRRRLQ
ncbi:MAG TPA: NAD(P)-binding domain-containing protein [Amycolatopsis sp.]|nr:NAD(P)-binding domain-containing protein [Amycolatopsis sp.]